MITSMNQNELFKTLVGHYKTNHYTYFPSDNSENSEKPGKTDEKLTIPEKAVSVKDMPLYKDISNERNSDRLELSEGIAYNSYPIGTTILKEGNVLDFIPYDAKEAVDFYGTNIRTDLEKGYENGVVTKERIAEYYGAMAKRLDQAYAEGKFTKEEFDELDEMITGQVERDAEAYENLKAFYALGKKRYSLPPEQVAEIVKREKAMTPEEVLASREMEIRDYAAKYCKIDRVSLMKLFSSIRYGE